tara:strand:+ start:672 stop:1874 length:1203 start_codon:yes stop_codon:yes gene_type:complete
MTIFKNNIGLLGLPNLGVTGINPNAQMPNMGLQQQLPSGGMGGQPTILNQTPTLPQFPSPQPQPMSFSDRLRNIGQRMFDYGVGYNKAGGYSFDPSAGDPKLPHTLGFENMQRQALNRQNLANVLQQQQFQNQIAQQENQMKLAKFSNEEEDRLLAKQQRERFKDIFSNIDRKNYANDNAYARAIGTELIKSGNIKDGMEFYKFGKPQTSKEYLGAVKDFRKTEQKLYDPLVKSVNNYKDLQTAINKNDGVGAYSAMIKYIKNLDDSVVREGEVNTFRRFQGLIKGMETAIKQNVAGENFPPEILASMDSIARQSIDTLVDSYNKNKMQKSAGMYPELGLDPKIIYSGMIVPDYGEPFSAQTNNNENNTETIGEINGEEIKIIKNNRTQQIDDNTWNAGK